MSTPQDQLGLGTTPMPQVPDESAMESRALDQYQSNIGKMQDVAGAEAQSIKGEEQQLSQMQPPTMDRGALFPSPFLIALAAIGGSTMKIHARVMLGALNGMVQGALKGDEMAYNQSMEQYQAQYQKMKDLADLQREYYDTFYKSYGQTAEAQMRAFMMAHALTDDKFKQEMAVANLSERNQLGMLQRMIAQQNLAEKVHHDRAMEEFAGLRTQAAMMNLKIQMQNKVITPEEYAIGGKIIERLGPHGMPTGMSGQTMITQIKMVEAANPGAPGDHIADLVAQGMAQGKALTAGASVAGRRTYQIDTALSAIMQPHTGLLDLTIQAAKDAGISNTKGIDLANIKLSEYSNNPAMRTFLRRMEDMKAEYVQALSKSGVASDKVREATDKAFPPVVTLAELERMRNDMPSELQAVESASKKGLQNLTGGGDIGDTGVGEQHKDGDKSTSKSGKPMVWRDGGWVYE